MSSSFSWADRLNIAVNVCLPCLHRTPSADSLTNSRATNSANPATGTTDLDVVPDDDLRRLLVDSDSDVLSLHSDIGNTTNARAARRKAAAAARNAKAGNGGWGIALFGYQLFGRPHPPIHLPTSPDDDDNNNNDSTYDTSHSHHHASSRRPRRGSIPSPGSVTRTTTLHSTATFDSDAAPLDADTIDNLSGTQAAALALAEEVERRAKEERRARRRERREMKKMARELAVQASVDDEFEGFQGSGQGLPTYSQWPTVSQSSATDDQVETEMVVERVPNPTQLLPHLAMSEEDDDEGADLDGMVYTRRHRAPPSTSRYSGGSDSRSRTSTSTSTSLTRPSKHEKKGKKSKSSHRSKSMLSSNDSTSIASPTSPAFNFTPHEAGNISIATAISPTTLEQGQGFFDYGGDEQPASISAYTPPVVKSRTTRGFPGTGFSVRAGTGTRDGAFLANTGSGVTESRAADGDERDDSFDGTF